MGDFDLFGSTSRKRTLGIRDKQILYHKVKGKCEGCGRKIDFSEMHSAHKKAHSKGGAATLANSVCLCARCNKLQGTDTFETFKKKMNGTYRKRTKKSSVKKSKTPHKKKKSEGLFDLPDLDFSIWKRKSNLFKHLSGF